MRDDVKRLESLRPLRAIPCHCILTADRTVLKSVYQFDYTTTRRVQPFCPREELGDGYYRASCPPPTGELGRQAGPIGRACRLMTEFYQQDLGMMSAPVRRALAFQYLMENKTIYIGEGELIVGEKGPAPKATPTYPELCCHTLARSGHPRFTREDRLCRRRRGYDECTKMLIPSGKVSPCATSFLAEMTRGVARGL